MNNTESTVVRFSLRWVLAAILVVFALGILGGMIGVNLYGPRTPLQLPGNQLVTNVQEVTVSPNKVISELVSSSERSVLQLAHGSRSAPTFLGTATVITNDGILLARHQPVQDDVFAIDTVGSYIGLDSVGRDDTYGIVFYRVRDGVLAPLELDTSNPDTGTSLLLLERSRKTNNPIVHTHQLEQYTVPPENSPPAWQQVGVLAPNLEAQVGSPLLTDDGKIAGLIVEANEPQVLPALYLRRSLERLAGGRREFNPFETYGFTVRPAFAAPGEQSAFTLIFTITSVDRSITPTLRAGDTLVAINDQNLTKDTDVAALLSETAPLTLTISRSDRQQAITIPSISPAP